VALLAHGPAPPAMAATSAVTESRSRGHRALSPGDKRHVRTAVWTTPHTSRCHIAVPFGVLRQTPGRLSQARSPVSPSRRNTPVALGLLRPAVHQCHDPARLRRLVAAGATAEHQRKGEQLKSPRACYHDHLRFSPTNRSVTNSGISVIAGPRTGRAPIISPSPCDDACQYG
jgi:hypothetical protein